MLLRRCLAGKSLFRRVRLTFTVASPRVVTTRRSVHQMSTQTAGNVGCTTQFVAISLNQDAACVATTRSICHRTMDRNRTFGRLECWTECEFSRGAHAAQLN